MRTASGIATAVASVLGLSVAFLTFAGSGSRVVAAPMLSGNAEAINVTITGARSTGSTGDSGMCKFVVTSNVTIRSIAAVPETAVAITPLVDWGGPNHSAGFQVPAKLSSTGTPRLTPGTIFQPGAGTTYRSVATTFSIPCAASSGELYLNVTDQSGTGSADVQFLRGGDLLPVGTVAATAAIIGISGLFLARQVRKGKPAAGRVRQFDQFGDRPMRPEPSIPVSGARNQ